MKVLSSTLNFKPDRARKRINPIFIQDKSNNCYDFKNNFMLLKHFEALETKDNKCYFSQNITALNPNA